MSVRMHVSTYAKNVRIQLEFEAKTIDTPAVGRRGSDFLPFLGEACREFSRELCGFEVSVNQPVRLTLLLLDGETVEQARVRGDALVERFRPAREAMWAADASARSRQDKAGPSEVPR